MKREIMVLIILFSFLHVVAAVTWDNAAYWSLNETNGNSALNNMNSSLNLTNDANMGSENWVVGKMGNALIFDGSNEYSTTFQNFPAISGNYTLSFWGNLTATDTGDVQTWISWSDTSGFAGLRVLTDENEQTIRTRPCVANSSCIDPTNHIGIPLNQWFHFVIVANGSYYTIYVNNTIRDIFWYDGTYYNANNKLSIGARWKEVADDWLSGSVDEVGFWNRALSSQEISELYNNGSGLAFPQSEETLNLSTFENVHVTNNLTISNNLSASKGFFDSLGTSISRIIKGWFTALDVSGASNLSGEVYFSNISCSAGQVLTTDANGLVSCTTLVEVKSGVVNADAGTPVVVEFMAPFSSTPHCTASIDLSGPDLAPQGFAFFTHAPNTTAIRIEWEDTGNNPNERIMWICTNAGNL